LATDSFNSVSLHQTQLQHNDIADSNKADLENMVIDVLYSHGVRMKHERVNGCVGTESVKGWERAWSVWWGCSG